MTGLQDTFLITLYVYKPQRKPVSAHFGYIKQGHAGIFGAFMWHWSQVSDDLCVGKYRSKLRILEHDWQKTATIM